MEYHLKYLSYQGFQTASIFSSQVLNGQKIDMFNGQFYCFQYYQKAIPNYRVRTLDVCPVISCKCKIFLSIKLLFGK